MGLGAEWKSTQAQGEAEGLELSEEGTLPTQTGEKELGELVAITTPQTTATDDLDESKNPSKASPPKDKT